MIIDDKRRQLFHRITFWLFVFQRNAASLKVDVSPILYATIIRKKSVL